MKKKGFPGGRSNRVNIRLLSNPKALSSAGPNFPPSIRPLGLGRKNMTDVVFFVTGPLPQNTTTQEMPSNTRRVSAVTHLIRPHAPALWQGACLALFFGLSLTPSEAQFLPPSDINMLLGGGQSQLGMPPLVLGSPPAAATTPAPAAPKMDYTATAGPWGDLRGSYIYLEAPKTLVENFPLPSTQPRWSFPKERASELPAILTKAGLAADLVARLISKERLVDEDPYIHMLPTVQEVEAMTPQSRSILYTELAKVPLNEFYVDPVLIIGTTVEDWYKGSKLRPELIGRIKALSYSRGETTAFSDISVLLNYAQSDSEARAIFKSFTRTRSLMVRLYLDKSSNVPEIVAYWSFGIGIRRKDIEPLIQSIIESESIHDLPLSHLLPALARKLIYTYPGLDLAKNGLLPDCHWTSLNFYNFEPHQYLLDSRLATSQVLESFTAVEPPYQFGDILFFLDNSTGDAFHSCVHLADSLVYTKNGRNVLSPWIISTLEDVKKVYLFRGNGRVQGFRRKDIDAARKNGGE
jgi:hypothetical protein